MLLLPIVIELWQVFAQFAALFLPEIDELFWCRDEISGMLQRSQTSYRLSAEAR